MPTATPRLDAKQCEQFERDGYFCPLPALEDADARRYLARYKEYCDANKAKLESLRPNEKYQVTSQTHYVLPWVYELITTPRILDTVESLLGPNILAWDTNWFSKMPGEKTYVSWHQDGTYWNLNPPTVVTAWVALTPCSAVNGCMRVVPGTHTKPNMPQRETYASDNALSRGQEIAVTVDESRAVDLKLQPGEMSLHHIWIVHGSNANTSPDTPRIGLAIRYTKPEVKQESPFRPMAMLVRGHDDVGNFDLRSPPTSNNLDTAREAHQKIVERLRKSILEVSKK